MDEVQSPNKSVVLIVENDPDMRTSHRTLLENAGFQVVEAESYDQAIARMGSSIHLVLLAFVLKDKSSLNILKYFHEHFHLCPLIMISTSADKDIAIKAVSNGAVDYLENSVNQFELIYTVQYWLSSFSVKSKDLRRFNCKAAQETLHESSEHLLGILESVKEAVISVDDSQHIIFFNKGAEVVFGYRKNEALGQPLEILLPENYRQTHHAKVAKFGNSPERILSLLAPHELEGRKKDGTIFPAEANISKHELNGKITLTVVLRDISERKKSEMTLHVSFVESVYTLMRAAEFRDDDTGSHVKRISYFSRTLAENMGMDTDFCDLIFYSSAMHDVGKIGIPDRILLKTRNLTPNEWEVMKTHTTIGGSILNRSSSPYLQMGEQIALAHHERWDGGGYPFGLQGDAIPLAARFMQLADIYDALRSKRPYKDAFNHSKSVEIILKGDGRTDPSHFDPSVLSAFVQCNDIFADIYHLLQSKRSVINASEHARLIEFILKGDLRTDPSHFEPAVLSAFEQCTEVMTDILSQRS
jgi:PAS domain S-box-containing protein